MTDLHYMQLAVDKAWRYQFLTYPNPAVGAVVVKNGTILSIEAHQKAGMAHAEVLALRAAYLSFYKNSPLQEIENSTKIHHYLAQHHNNFFCDCEIYVTLEPCNHHGKTPPCALLLVQVGIKKVIIGSIDCNSEATGGLQRLQNKGIPTQIGVNKKQTDHLLFPFQKWQKERFVFFKIAMRSDGSVKGGYITTQDSLNLVHKIRQNLDLLVVGGETVRIDRPTLDTRFCGGESSPDILIYSKQDPKTFDQTIPLFLVPQREVEIKNTLKSLHKKKFVMVEGGYTLLEKIKSQLDYLVVFLSQKKQTQNPVDLKKLGFKEVYRYSINEDDSVIFLENS